MSSTLKSIISVVEGTASTVQPTAFSTAQAIKRLLILVGTLALIMFAMATVIGLRLSNSTYYWYSPLTNLYSLAIPGFIFSRFLPSLLYRPPRDFSITPSVSSIITAFNEEDAIYRTVECCYAINYPMHLCEVIVFDDGSADGTVRETRRAQERRPKLKLEVFGYNKGKREAMAAGARVANGEILVYVDSDSFVQRDGVLKIVQGFSDPGVAAVAGHPEVANVRENRLTKMQQARYYVAFRVIKAAESLFGTVTCCPGCFSRIAVVA